MLYCCGIKVLTFYHYSRRGCEPEGKWEGHGSLCPYPISLWQLFLSLIVMVRSGVGMRGHAWTAKEVNQSVDIRQQRQQLNYSYIEVGVTVAYLGQRASEGPLARGTICFPWLDSITLCLSWPRSSKVLWSPVFRELRKVNENLGQISLPTDTVDWRDIRTWTVIAFWMAAAWNGLLGWPRLWVETQVLLEDPQ